MSGFSFSFKPFAFGFLSVSLQVCLLLVLLLSSVATVRAQTGFPCTYTTQNNTLYNLTSLMGFQITGSSPTGDNNYYLSMCGVAPFCKRDGSMACQAAPGQSPESVNVYDVAYSNDDIAPHFWSVVPGGIQLTAYGSRIYCTNSGDERTGKFTIYCDPRYNGTITSFTGPVVESPTCTYNFYINHTAGCPLALPPATTQPPVTTTTTIAPTPCSCEIATTSTDQTTFTGAGFGVGVGVGIVICAATTIAYVFITRRLGKRRWKQMDDEPKGMQMGTLESGATSDETTA